MAQAEADAGVFDKALGAGERRQAASSRELLELRTRIIALEAAVQHLPDQAAITELLGDMKAVRAELTAMQGLTRAVDRINDYLLRERP
ncbi:TPA: DUF2730 domain-containing protein [Pseudomonas aeruginosa]